ncbi:MAG TPA: hypothetical protein VHG28_08985 [Longimicrobiaceae bacterium]|nr:hypothetical protein [Longimicrobiaceae bacterium]
MSRFESRFQRWRPTPKPGWRERSALEEVGGTLYDLGSHLIDQALVALRSGARGVRGAGRPGWACGRGIYAPVVGFPRRGR